MDDEYRMTMYQGFFDELSVLEKQAMLEKQAINAMGAGNLLRTGKSMLKAPADALKTLGGTFSRGMSKAPKDASQWGRLGQGAKALWNTPGGRAAAIGTGALGVGGLATAGALGRATAPRQ